GRTARTHVEIDRHGRRERGQQSPAEHRVRSVVLGPGSSTNNPEGKSFERKRRSSFGRASRWAARRESGPTAPDFRKYPPCRRMCGKPRVGMEPLSSIPPPPSEIEGTAAPRTVRHVLAVGGGR